ncbi:MAG: hypothetical protein AAF593_01945 [Planctomycetota bacterium]
MSVIPDVYTPNFVDRAARNLFGSVDLERLETDHGLPVIYVNQPTENTPEHPKTPRPSA